MTYWEAALVALFALLAVSLEVVYLARGGTQYLVGYLASVSAAAGLLAAHNVTAGVIAGLLLFGLGMAMHGIRRHTERRDEDDEQASADTGEGWTGGGVRRGHHDSHERGR